jgi:alkaline phosphatase D
MALLDRRRFLNIVTLAAGTMALGLSPLVEAAHPEDGEVRWRGVRRRVRPGRRFFPQSVLSAEPRTGSVILWARVEDADHAGQDLPLTLLVAADPWMARIVAAQDVQARAADGNVVQVKLVGLSPRTRYYYRFVYEKSGQYWGSGIGRTQTAPAPADTAPVRFAFASCQDAIGRYYNTYFSTLVQELDFVVHLGDYIYESSGDPSFQNTGGRGFQFTDLAGAVSVGSGASRYYAAASLSNYREIYRFYRSDPILQRMHERFAFVNIWDDHEYSDDCWGATGTYTNGLHDETSVNRRRNAERAYFENVPIDPDTLPAGAVDLSLTPVYPDARIYRDFRYGANLHLFLTDYRSFRPDHLIPEDAFPGAVPVDKAGLILLLGLATYEFVKGNFAPYIDLDATPADPVPAAILAGYRQVLQGGLTLAYLQAGLAAPEAVAKAAGNAKGKIDIRVLNTFVAGYNATVDPTRALPLATEAGLDRGISFLILGKQSLFSSLGARYFVVKDTFDLYAAYRSASGGRAVEDAYGPAQLTWLQSGLLQTSARWKVVGNSTSLTSMVLDLTGSAPGLPQAVKDLLALLPAQLRNRFYLNVDQMDGFPNFRRALLALYDQVPGVALIAGDIHAAFATEHTGGIWEFTGPAVSSFAFRQGVAGTVAADPTLSQIPGLAALVDQLDLLLQSANDQIRYANTGVNGIVVLEATPNRLSAIYHQIDGAEAPTSYYDRPWRLIGKFTTKRFDIAAEGVAQAPATRPSIAV